MSDEPGTRILTTWRVPEGQVNGTCGMCGRERLLVFDLTAGGHGELEVLSVCDECAPRAEALMAWLGRITA